MLSPVDGTVIAVNPRLGESSGVVSDSPYGEGWLLKVRTSRLAGNLKSLMSGSLSAKWMDTVCESLGAEMAPMGLGEVYLDGGQLVDGLARSLSPEDWDRVARRFFLTEDGGRHA
jgi:hypothetical protein